MRNVIVLEISRWQGVYPARRHEDLMGGGGGKIRTFCLLPEYSLPSVMIGNYLKN